MFVNTVLYDIADVNIGSPELSAALEAYAAIVRLDERARRSPLTRGWQERLLLDEALACQLAEGNLVHLDDLVLLDGNLRHGKTHPDLRDTLDMLRTWRRAMAGDAAALLCAERPGIDDIADDDDEALPHMPMSCNAVLIDGPIDGQPQTDALALEQWRRAVRPTERLPPLLAAAAAWDLWLELMPEPGGAWRASLLAALVLRQHGVTHSYLLPIDSGRRISSYRRKPGQTPDERWMGVISWMHAAATRSYKQFDALSLAEQQLRRCEAKRRRSSRVGDLVDLFLSRPLVTIPMAARHLGCTTQAIEKMLPLLGSTPVLMTERKRFRAWRVA